MLFATHILEVEENEDEAPSSEQFPVRAGQDDMRIRKTKRV